VSESDLRTALAALAAGDRDPALALVTDALQEQLMMVGEPDEVSQRLAALVREHQPDSIGLAVTQPDMEGGLRQAARALALAKRLAV
jgi:alkanesulfonate monooxygenase SsuD/methylene tetrahydromethanopterin reductase-like flavin-dependent oxidoreductase (luciferase family)